LKASKRPDSKAASGLIAGLETTAKRVLVELLSIAREMLRIPAGLYMRVAEAAGAVVLAAWLRLWPLLQAGWRLLRRVVRWGEVRVTPIRALIVVAAATAVALIGSQFADYTHVAIGTDQYSGLSRVAPAPIAEGSTSQTGDAHAWLGLVLGLGALAAVVGVALGRLSLARVLIPIGLVTIVISLAIDLPKGLDEGDAAVAYEGAKATLLGGFWAQLVSGALLVALAPLIALNSGSRPQRVPQARRLKLPSLHLGMRKATR
jgi:hypothetical protein